jgi:threonine/homoserine/homoserine lactone efflux protein
MRDLPALVLFALVSSGTPGPNNVLLWASGLQFGFRATVPQVLGTSAGIGILALAVAAGLGVLVTGLPEVELTLKLVGSLYLLYFAFRLAGGAAIQRAQIARPLRFHEAAAFQFLNPKAWLFALAALSTFRPDDLPVAIGSAAVILTMIVVVLPTAALWGRRWDRIAPAHREPTSTTRSQRRTRSPPRPEHRVHLDLKAGDGKNQRTGAVRYTYGAERDSSC